MSHIKSDRILISIYLLLLFAHVALIWVLKYIPTQDGPSHIYNLAILRDLLQGGEIWGEYYTHDLKLIPNLGFHIFTYPLTAFLSPWQAEKAFLTLYICLMGLSVPVLLKTFHRPVFPVCFLVFPVIFNFTLMMGFYSYSMAIPFFLLFFSLAWTIRSKPTYWKASIYTLCGLFLFCLHILPFGIYIIALVSISASQYFEKNWNIKIILNDLALISPLLFLFCYYLLTNHNGTFFSLDYLFSLKRNVFLLLHLITFSSIIYYAKAYLIPVVLFGAIAWTMLGISLRNMFIHKEQVQVFLTPSVLVALALLCVYFLFPFVLAGGAYFNQRLPWVIFLLLLPLLTMPFNYAFCRTGSVIIVLAVITVFGFNSFFMLKHSRIVEQYTSGLSVPIPQNSLIMDYRKTGLDTSRADVLLHAVSHYALAHKAVNVGNYQAGLEYFPVRYRKGLSPLPSRTLIENSPWKIDWSHYQNIEFLVAWRITQDKRDKINRFFGLVFEKNDLSIWRRIRQGSK